MTEALENYFNGLSAQLTGYEALNGETGWAQLHFGRALTEIKSNVPMEKIKASDCPALLYDVGDFDSEIQVHGHQQIVAHDIELAVVWHNEDYAEAFTQRLQLPGIIMKAVMSDHTLNSNVQGAWIREGGTDRGVFYPYHVMRFTVTGRYVVNKV